MRHDLRHAILRKLRRLGVDVKRYPATDSTWLLTRLLATADVSQVIDVGANGGRYGNELREAGWTGPIVSLEPLGEPFRRLVEASRRDASWTALQMAAGDERHDAQMHVASNAGESSSLLTMLDAHSDAAPMISIVGTENVAVHRIDDLLGTTIPARERSFLKVDAQGYEMAVLRGASRFVDEFCSGLQLEVSLVDLYDGAPRPDELFDAVTGLGFTLASVIPGFVDIQTGRMLQCDCVFARPSVFTTAG